MRRIGTKDLKCKLLSRDYEGCRFLEKVYQKAMQVELLQNGLQAELEQPIKIRFKGAIVGDYYADLLVEGKVISGSPGPPWERGQTQRRGTVAQRVEGYRDGSRAADQLRGPKSRVQEACVIKSIRV
jgi:hypothetical protein